MNEKERHVRENKPYETPDQIAGSMPAEGKTHKRTDTVRANRRWMWLGIIVLIFILLYWLFAVGTFEDMLGVFNG